MIDTAYDRLDTTTQSHLRLIASFTAEPLRGVLDRWLSLLGIDLEVRFADYGQVLQEALDPSSGCARNGAGGANVFLIRPVDLGSAWDEVVAAITALASRSAAPVFVMVCPQAAEDPALADPEAALAGQARIDLIRAAELGALYPVDEPFDSEAEASGHIPYTEAMFAALATLLVRRLSLRRRPPVKVLALDADNTLWGGICGEDGPAGLDLDGPWRALRDFAETKRREGLLLTLVSKNQEADVDRVFAERGADLGLSRASFSGWKANWNPKSQSLRELAAELNLGLDSIVFLDDNPAEVAEVRANAPGVLALTLPSSPEEIPVFLRHLWALDTLPATEEDKARVAFYQQEAERRELRAAAPSFADFLRGLELDVAIAEAQPEDLARIAQLTKRTNQFNLHPRRLSEPELEALIASGADCLTVRVRDRFGDYGLVGVMLAGPRQGAQFPVELFLLSCRAMGKGVERRMLAALAKRALEQGAERLQMACLETERNEPARRFFERMGGLSLDTNRLAELSPYPEETEGEGEPAANPAPPAKGNVGATLFDADLAQRVATEWRRPEAILAAFLEKRPRPDLSQALVHPGSAIQQRLAAIWCDVLGLEEVGIEDPFSALGGSSLQLVRLHAQLQRAFGIDWELVELFELPTIRDQAARLEQGEGSTDRFEILSSNTESSPSAEEDGVAIIGLALRVPGASDPESFWQNLVDGVESITHFEREELEYPDEFGKPGYIPAKGLLDGVELFDAAFFGILPKEAAIMDPQQRLFLELAWEAMERSGYTPETHRGRIGVYAGAYFDTYLLANLCSDREFMEKWIPQIQVGSLQTELGNDKDYLATRVAFKLNLRGPAMTLQTACSTSMVAIVEACRAIRSGLCDMALAGGVTVTVPLKRGYYYTEQGMLSADGHCRTFDAEASGTVFGNGAGVVMLKRLCDARRDRDHIHAVIRGTGLNNDGGVKHSYTAPSVEGQVEVIRMAHHDAGVDPSSIGYVEAHGTATPLGDPIEVAALTKAFRAGGAEETQYCALGSLKSNIGHLDVASGVCGLIKATLSLEQKTLPPLLHFQKPNPKIDFANSPFFVNAQLRPWKEGRHGQPRRAGISAFGVGGTNAHVVVEEAPAWVSSPSTRSRQLYVLSARSEAALGEAAERLARYAEQGREVEPADVAWTLAIGRKPFRHRRAVVAADLAELASALREGRGGMGVADRQDPPLAFLFPGQGAQHLGMGRAYYENEAPFRRVIEECSEILEPMLGLKLVEALYPGVDADLEVARQQLQHTVLAQPAIFVLEYALAELWRRWGIEPSLMVGHSVGEFVAACQAGVFDLESGLRLLAARGRLMGELPGGGMLSVRLPEAELVDRLPEDLDLAAVNGPSLCVVAGAHDSLERFRSALEAEGVVAQALHTSHAFHSRHMDPVVDRFAAEFAGVRLKAPNKPIFSTVTGQWLGEAEACDPLYWARHLREPVRFYPALLALGAEAPGQIYLEVGPGTTLASLARQALDRKSHPLILSTCRHVKEPGCDYAHGLESLGRLWSHGVTVDWEAFFGEEARWRVPLPTYPFERKRHWIDPKPFRPTSSVEALPRPESAPVPAEPVPPMSTPASTCRRDAIAAALRSVLTELSGIPAEELDSQASFLELGFDSLLLTQVSKALGKELGLNLNLRDLMGELSTIEAMVNHADATLPAERYREAVIEPVQVSGSSVPEAPTTVTAAPVQEMTPRSVATASNQGGGAQSNVATMVSRPISSLQSRGGVEGLIAQQLELMRQQLALLQGEGAAESVPPQGLATPAAPVALPALTPAAAPAASSSSLATESGATAAPTSAPVLSIQRNLGDTLTDRQQAHLDDLVAKYVAKTQQSKALTDRYRRWHADPRTVSGFNRRWKEMIYQLVVVKSKGSRLLDIDGNEYIDLLNGFGPNFLGHSPDFITEALKEQLDRGVEVGPQSLAAMEVAQLFCEITGNERASFVNTGSEAVQAAMRLARTVTGRDKIVVFARDYHGNFDEVLVRAVGSGDQLRSMPIAPGIPRRAVEDVIVLPYGTEESLDLIRRRAHELAAVIVEPIQSRRPEFQPREFIHALRAITRESGTVFVFDEVITGFRTGPRGAQEFYGVEADIATYGKVVGGGMPLGVVAGKAEFMDTFDGGLWQYGDDSFPEKGVTFFAGTFVRHPLAMTAAKAVLLHLRKQGPEFWQGVKDRATRLAGTVDRMFVENGAPFRMPNFGSQMFVRADENHPYANLLFFHLRHKGVFLLEGFPTYMTAAHTDEDIDYCIAAFQESVAELQEGGFFDLPAGKRMPYLNGSRLSGPHRLLNAESVVPSPVTVSSEAPAPSESPASTPTPADGADAPAKSPAATRFHPMTEPLAEVWLASQMSRNASLCFNEINLIHLSGPLDRKALDGALQDLVDRHDALRAHFPSGGEGFLVQEEMKVQPEYVDLAAMESAEREAAVAETLERERNTPFSLESGPLVRATLLRLAEEEHLLIFDAHHVVCDGWSYKVVLSDLSEFYRARVEGRPPKMGVAPRFADHCERVAAQESLAEESDADRHWQQEFAEPVPPIALPLDFPRPAEADCICDTVAEQLSPEQLRDLKKVAGKSGATLFGLLFSAYQILLHRLARQGRFVVGFPAAGQNASGEAELVGHCVHFLPFVAKVDPQAPFREHLQATQGRLLDAFEHQDITYGRLIKKFRMEDRPRIEAVFNFERTEDDLNLPGLKTTVTEIERGYASNPLFLKTREYEGGLEIRFDFQSALFRRDTVKQWLTIYRTILEQLLESADLSVAEVGAVLSPEQQRQLREWNDTATDYPRDCTAVQVFEAVAATRGDAPALRHESGETSYGDLARQVRQLALGLAEAGVKRGDRVALFLERRPEAIAAIYAIWKVGAVCVPLDPDYPAERLHFLVSDSGASFAITEPNWAERLPQTLERRPPEQLLREGGRSPLDLDGMGNVDPLDPAILFYTSGSTGQPKGALIPHRAIVRLVRSTDYVHFGEDEVFLYAASPCFDAALFEIHGSLLNGGILALPPMGRIDLAVLTETLTKHQVTTLWLTAGLFQVVVEECLDAFAGLRQLVTGGDKMSPSHAAKVMEAYPELRLVNGYGPTENTTFTACHDIVSEDLHAATVPIGRAIANTTTWILDDAGQLVPPGAPGELCCGGDGLTLGYLNRPQWNEERFLPHPLDPAQRLYRTGDLCRQRADGVILFLGRIDHQVKIRGFRVEPAEIEAVLTQHPMVGQGKVLAVGEDAANKRLVAYVSPRHGAKPGAEELLAYLRSKLPDYLVPASLMVLDELPLNANGKVDVHALPDPGREAVRVHENRPPTETEAALAAIWKELLRLPEVGLDDDFFSLGGHSLLGMRLLVRLQKRFDLNLPLAVLFRAPSVRQLAMLIDGKKAPQSEPEASPASERPLGEAVAVAQERDEVAYSVGVLETESETRTAQAASTVSEGGRKGGIHLAPAARSATVPLADTTVPIQPKGDRPPLFAVHGGDGGILFYGELAQRLGEDRPFYAFEAPALTASSPIPEESVEETAAQYLAELKKVQASGPFHLCGYSFGGVVAYEMARQLSAEGETVAFLGLVDTENPAAQVRKLSLGERLAVNWNKQSLAEKGVLEKVGSLGKRIGSGLAYRLYFEAEDAVARTLPQAKGAGWLRQVQLRKAHEKAMAAYVPGPFEGRLTLFRAMVGGDKYDVGADYGWDELVDELEIVDVPGNHITVFHKENIEAMAAAFRQALEGVTC